MPFRNRSTIHVCVVAILFLGLTFAEVTAQDLAGDEPVAEADEEQRSDSPELTGGEGVQADNLSDTLGLLFQNHRALRLEVQRMERQIQAVRRELEISEQMIRQILEAMDEERVLVQEDLPDTPAERELEEEEEIPPDPPEVEPEPDAPEEVPEVDVTDRLLNPNEASLEELQALPGVTDRLARRIDWYRNNVGPFEEPEDLRKVPGLTEEQFETLSERLEPGPY